MAEDFHTQPITEDDDEYFENRVSEVEQENHGDGIKNVQKKFSKELLSLKKSQFALALKLLRALVYRMLALLNPSNPLKLLPYLVLDRQLKNLQKKLGRQQSSKKTQKEAKSESQKVLRQELDETIDMHIETQGLSPTMFIDTKQFLNLAIMYPCIECGQFGGKLQDVIMSVKKNVLVTVSKLCAECKNGRTHVANYVDDVIPKFLACQGAAVTGAGITYSVAQRYSSMIGLNYIPATPFYDMLSEEFDNIVFAEANRLSMQRLRQAMADAKRRGLSILFVSADGNWTHVRGAGEGGVLLVYGIPMDDNKYYVIQFATTQRSRKGKEGATVREGHQDPSRAFESRNMKAVLTNEEFVAALKAENLSLSLTVDGDLGLVKLGNELAHVAEMGADYSHDKKLIFKRFDGTLAFKEFANFRCLKDIFGYDGFKDIQEHVLKCVIEEDKSAM
ncbi:hypothetical protein HDU98_000349, partial [Podochytrium sp. JEL0797]